MRRFHNSIKIIVLATLCLPQLARADGPAGWHERFTQAMRRPVRSNAREMGQALFQKAKAFAEAERLPHFVERGRNGKERLVMNVHGESGLRHYTQAFGQGDNVLENFFSASASSKPGWSYHRIGDRRWNQFGEGDAYSMRTYGTRTAFPYMVSAEELQDHMRDLREIPNPSFDSDPPHMGGLLSGRFLRNCTDWITALSGKFMGMAPTIAVVSHGGQLFDGSLGDRMTVKTVITQNPIAEENFNAEALTRRW